MAEPADRSRARRRARRPSSSTSPSSSSSRSGLGRLGARHHRRRRPERRRHPLPLRFARRPRRRGDRPPGRRPRGPSPRRARRAAARAGPADHPRRRAGLLVFAYVGLVEAEGPDAQRWIDLMHALWLDRSPALAFMARVRRRGARLGAPRPRRAAAPAARRVRRPLRARDRDHHRRAAHPVAARRARRA